MTESMTHIFLPKRLRGSKVEMKPFLLLPFTERERLII